MSWDEDLEVVVRNAMLRHTNAVRTYTSIVIRFFGQFEMGKLRNNDHKVFVNYEIIV